MVADLVAIVGGHTPGTPVTGGHEDLLFRASRVHANTAESIGAVILIAGFAIAVGTEPKWTAKVLWAFFGCRVGHMLAYYLDLRIPRSIAFGLGATALVVLFFSAVLAL